jgi:hypothetical protein
MAGYREASVFSAIPNENRDGTCKIVAGRVGASPFGSSARDTGSAGEMALRADTISLGGPELCWIDDCRTSGAAHSSSRLDGGHVTLSRTVTALTPDTGFKEGLLAVVLILRAGYGLKAARMTEQTSWLDTPCKVDVALSLKSWRSSICVTLGVVRDR